MTKIGLGLEKFNLRGARDWFLREGGIAVDDAVWEEDDGEQVAPERRWRSW